MTLLAYLTLALFQLWPFPGPGRSGAAPSGPTELASDNFDRANGAIGDNWTNDGGVWSIYSNTAYVSTSGSYGNGLAHWSGTSPGWHQDQYARGTAVNTGTDYQGGGPAVRVSASSGYFTVARYSTELTLYKYSPSTEPTAMCSSDHGQSPATIANGDVIQIEASGSNPTTITVKRISGTPATLITCEDSSSPYSTGTPGLGFFYNNVGAVDDWSGGNL